jgi:hypothetical protein
MQKAIRRGLTHLALRASATLMAIALRTFDDHRLTVSRTPAQVRRMDLSALWLRAWYARLLIYSTNRVAAGEYEAARSDVGRIFDRYGARGVEVPIRAEIMRLLIAWNLCEYDGTALSVRQAVDKLDRRLTKER